MDYKGQEKVKVITGQFEGIYGYVMVIKLLFAKMKLNLYITTIFQKE